jgi:hypothetical protein
MNTSDWSDSLIQPLFAAVVRAPDPGSSASATNDIRALKSLAPAPPLAWYWWVVIVVGVLALAGLVAWYLRRTRPPAPPPPLPPAHVRARKRLQAALELLQDPREFCIRVSDALRWYLEVQLTLRAPERTTEEFLNELQASPRLTAAQKAALATFLESCDLVKFARHEPTEADLLNLHRAALNLVDETAPNELETVTSRDR